MKQKFKPGDIVRCLTDYKGQFTKGGLYTVLSHERGRVLVTLDDSFSSTNGWGEAHFEPLVPRHAGTYDYVVMACENGHYKPASEPRVYSSREQALKVASKLAKQHGGRFVAFHAVGEAVMPRAEPTITEWN